MYSVITRHMSSYPIKERERKDGLEAFRDALLLHEPFYFLQLTKQGSGVGNNELFSGRKGGRQG